MKSREVSAFRSFRFKIILYTLLSLLYAVTTEAILIGLIWGIGQMTRPNTNMSMNMSSAVNEIAENSEDTMQAVENVRKIGNYVPPELHQSVPAKHHVALTLCLLFTFGTFLFVLYFLLLTKKFSNYLHEITTGIKRIATGDFSTRILIQDKDEFAFIGNCLNDMADDIILLMENERKSEKIKNNLITNVAHDLRTPLTSIIGYLDLIIRDEKLDQEKKDKYMHIAYDKSLRLEKLIGDLFNFTKFSSGEMKLNLERIDIVKLMEQMTEEFYPLFQEVGLLCSFTSEEDSAVITGDGNLLARAFSNLLANAVKYGKDGKNIVIKIKQNETEVSVSIINYGEIIPEAELEYVFDRFYRVESSRNTQTGGTGLGLAIAKTIAQMHGGSIQASSSRDGTVFEMILQKGGPAGGEEK